MYLTDSHSEVVNAEFSLDVLDGAPCIVIESSGGAKKSQGVVRRNPDYNKLLKLLFERFAAIQVQIVSVELCSKPVENLSFSERIVHVDYPYPIDLRIIDGESLRLSIGRAVAQMHQSPSATKSGNAQKRIRIVLNRVVTPEELEPSLVSPSLVKVEPSDFCPGLSITEREFIANARIGQGDFRRKLLKRFGACPVLGIFNAELLIASHIKPWKACNNPERLDVNNGLILSALIDRLFDRGLITFDELGAMIISPCLSFQDRKTCQLDRPVEILLPKESLRYLEYHRLFVFKA